MQGSSEQQNPWAAICGQRTDGRGRVLQEVIDALRDSGLRVGGFVQEPVRQAGEVIGWDAVQVGSGQRCVLVRTSTEPDICEWGFNRASIEICRGWATQPRLDVSVLELGRIEARGQGHHQALQEVLSGPRRLALLSIRPHPLAAIALQLPDPVAGLELPCDDSQHRSFVDALRAVQADGA